MRGAVLEVAVTPEGVYHFGGSLNGVNTSEIFHNYYTTGIRSREDLVRQGATFSAVDLPTPKRVFRRGDVVRGVVSGDYYVRLYDAWVDGIGLVVTDSEIRENHDLYPYVGNLDDLGDDPEC